MREISSMKKCKHCGFEWKDGSGASRFTNCPSCKESVTKKSSDWQFFDNTKELLAYIAITYGNDALLKKTYFSDHASSLMPQGQKNLVKQAFECGAVKTLWDNINSDQNNKEIAVKQAVKKLVDTYSSADAAAERVVWEFTNAFNWGMLEPQLNEKEENENNSLKNTPPPPIIQPTTPIFTPVTTSNRKFPAVISIVIAILVLIIICLGLGIYLLMDSDVIDDGEEIDRTVDLEETNKPELRDDIFTPSMPPTTTTTPPVTTTTPIITTTSEVIIEPPVPQIAVGDTIHFGGFNWQVIDVRNGEALILSDRILEDRMYHPTQIDITWEDSELRSYLNNEFYNRFNAVDRERIVETKIINNDNQWYGISGGNDTMDKIFLLSLHEIVSYFGDSGQLRNRPANALYISDQFNSSRIVTRGDGSSAWWWLRSPGDYSATASFVYGNGRIGIDDRDGKGVASAGGIRPALWLKL
jgi:hypothetical protein